MGLGVFTFWYLWSFGPPLLFCLKNLLCRWDKARVTSKYFLKKTSYHNVFHNVSQDLKLIFFSRSTSQRLLETTSRKRSTSSIPLPCTLPRRVWRSALTWKREWLRTGTCLNRLVIRLIPIPYYFVPLPNEKNHATLLKNLKSKL